MPPPAGVALCGYESIPRLHAICSECVHAPVIAWGAGAALGLRPLPPSLRFSCDLIQNRIGVAQHLVVPKSESPISHLFQIQSAQLVRLQLFRLETLAAIQLDDQPDFQADEIQIERSHLM